jgi:hypothetical protein
MLDSGLVVAWRRLGGGLAVAWWAAWQVAWQLGGNGSGSGSGSRFLIRRHELFQKHNLIHKNFKQNKR